MWILGGVIIGIFIMLVLIVSLSEPLIPYRGVSSERKSFSYKDWEDPVYSNFHATRLIGGGIPDECRDDVVGPDVARITPEDSAFLASRGIKLQSSAAPKLRSEAFGCGALADEAAAVYTLTTGPPLIYQHGSPILQINKALADKTWDPVLTGPNYSYKI